MNHIDEKLREQIATRAQAEPAFRSALLSNPRAALEEMLGTALPAQLKVTVIEDTTAELHLVIPQPTTDELCEEELNAVAGGVTVNKAKSAQKQADAMDAYIRG